MIYEVWTVEKVPRIAFGAIYTYAEAERLAKYFRDTSGPATVRRGRRPYTLKPDRRG